MILLYGIGLILLVAAFLGGAAEIAARGSLDESRWMLSGLETLRLLRPSVPVALREAVGPGLWPIVEGMLAVPFWVLFGLPGGILAAIGRPRHDDVEGPDEESLFLYDRLVERAREEGYVTEPGDEPQPHESLPEADEADQEGDDLAPSHHDGLAGEETGGDDSAPTDHDYVPPDLGDIKDWAAEPDRPPEPYPPGEKPAKPLVVPEPPPAGLGRWIAPPPKEDE
jgi:hypothetical protein